MKLLFDENLSHKLVTKLSLDFPDSEHVRNVGLKGADDNQIWEYAKSNGFIIVSKDTDFRERSFVEGFPPKTIWLGVGNVGTQAIAELLKQRRSRIESFNAQIESSVLMIQ